MYTNRRNSRILQEIGVEEHDDDIRFLTASGNITLIVYYRNRSVFVDLLWGRCHVPQNVFPVLQAFFDLPLGLAPSSS